MKFIPNVLPRLSIDHGKFQYFWFHSFFLIAKTVGPVFIESIGICPKTKFLGQVTNTHIHRHANTLTKHTYTHTHTHTHTLKHTHTFTH